MGPWPWERGRSPRKPKEGPRCPRRPQEAAGEPKRPPRRLPGGLGRAQETPRRRKEAPGSDVEVNMHPQKRPGTSNIALPPPRAQKAPGPGWPKVKFLGVFDKFSEFFFPRKIR